MARHGSHRSAAPAAPPPPWSDRLLAALLAPLAFNLFLLICVCMAGRRLTLRASGPWPWDGPTAAWVCLFLPALAGFVGGTVGLVSMAGHAFLTHAAHEQRAWATLLIWAVVLGSGYLVWHR
jgi:hypothetical protein